MSTAADAFRQDGIAVVPTADGVELPVIDITHPRFTVPDAPEDIEALREAVLASDSWWRWLPGFIARGMLRAAAQTSPLMRALFGGDAPFLDSVSTYLLKLGPGNLPPPYDGPLDREFAASPHLALMRLRLQQMAKLIAAGALRAVSTDDRPLHLVDIGGGTAMDAINALILLARSSPDRLMRPVVVHVLDLDPAGPAFGRAALAALKCEGGGLRGFDVELRPRDYDWRDASPLGELMDELGRQGGIVVAASEGGLFEYGSDDAIVANLAALRAGGSGASCVVGSVTCADDLRRRMIAGHRFALVPRGLEGFRPLAAQAGFRIVEARHAVLSDQVMLQPMPAA